MKTIAALTFIVLFSITTSAQSYLTQAKPAGSKTWGYINTQNDFSLKPIYKKCYAFAENGLAPIYENKTFQFIKTNGETISTDVSADAWWTSNVSMVTPSEKIDL